MSIILGAIRNIKGFVMYKNYKIAGDLGAAKETASSKFTKGFILMPYVAFLWLELVMDDLLLCLPLNIFPHSWEEKYGWVDLPPARTITFRQ